MTIEDLFDRRVPLAIAAALCVQAGSIVWWAAAHDADQRFQQQRIEHLEESVTDARALQSEILQRLARIEERGAAEAATLERIEKDMRHERR